MKPVQAYKCDFCPKCFGRKGNAARHEETCGNNPSQNRCKTCKHCTKIEDPNYSGDPNSIFAPIIGWQPFCKIHQMLVFDQPYLKNCETRSDPYPEDPIYGTCFDYEYKGYAKYEEIKEISEDE